MLDPSISMEGAMENRYLDFFTFCARFRHVPELSSATKRTISTLHHLVIDNVGKSCLQHGSFFIPFSYRFRHLFFH